jgi:hypothetical protein
MKYLLLLLLALCSTSVFAQQFRYYINGNTVAEATPAHFESGDLFRVMFINKHNHYRFKIAAVGVTLTPSTEGSNAGVLNRVTKFIIVNPSSKFSANPDFSFDLLSKLAVLSYNYSEISFQVQVLESDSAEGNEWIQKNVQFNGARIKGPSAK